MNISDEILKKIIVEEQPVSLADILLRRTGIGWDIDQGKSAVPGVATVMAELCGWDEQRKEKEMQLFHQHIKEIYQVQKYRGDSVCDQCVVEEGVKLCSPLLIGTDNVHLSF